MKSTEAVKNSLSKYVKKSIPAASTTEMDFYEIKKNMRIFTAQ